MAILGIRIGSLLLEAYACAAEKGHAYGLLHPFTWFTTPVYMVYYTRLHGLLHPFILPLGKLYTFTLIN